MIYIEGTFTTEASERIYQTVTYGCGHAMLRATFRKHMDLRELHDLPREITDEWHVCKHCHVARERFYERRIEKANGYREDKAS